MEWGVHGTWPRGMGSAPPPPPQSTVLCGGECPTADLPAIGRASLCTAALRPIPPTSGPCPAHRPSQGPCPLPLCAPQVRKSELGPMIQGAVSAFTLSIQETMEKPQFEIYGDDSKAHSQQVWAVRWGCPPPPAGH